MQKIVAPRLRLEIVSDTICPWCYVAKRRLEEALRIVGDDLVFDFVWRPFELNPDMPREGLDRKAYRSAKFGSWEKSLALDSQVAHAGGEAGLTFHHERMTRTPNTLASHVLILLAGEHGRQDDVVEALFSAYFVDGRDVGNEAVLTDIGVAAGLDRDSVIAALQDEALRSDVKAEAAALTQAGIGGVPTVLLNRFVLFSGAQRPQLMAQTLRQAAANDKVISAGMEATS